MLFFSEKEQERSIRDEMEARGYQFVRVNYAASLGLESLLKDRLDDG